MRLLLEPESNRTRQEKETGRIEAFSDGVFAIAITLLVLDMKVPTARDLQGGHGLLAALLKQWPTDLAFVISFLTVLIMWLNHHRLFSHIKYCDHRLLLLNGLLLMGVTVVPFPTALLAQCLTTPDAPVAAAVYSGIFVFIAVCFNLLWRYASGHQRLLDEAHEPERVAAITRQYRFGPLLYVVAFAAAFVSATISIGLCLALAVFFALPNAP